MSPTGTEHTEHTDVVIIGLGAMGSAAAHHLAARGTSVIGLEQFTPAHDLGSSHGDSRIIRQAYFEHPSYVPLLRSAYDLWGRLEQESGRELLTLTGGMMIGRPDSGTVSGTLASAQQWDLEHEVLDPDQALRRFGTFRLQPDEIAVHEDRAGYVVPEQTVLAQLDVARRHGADLRFEQRVTDWQPNGSGVRVTTATGSIDADRLIVSAGAWAPRIAKLEFPLHAERQIMHWYATDDPAPFMAPDHPIYVWEDPTGDQIYGFPIKPGEDLAKVAFFRRKVVTDPDRVDRTVHSDEIDEITAYLSSRFPGMVRHEKALTCLYTLTPDHHFVLGPHPEHPQVTVAAGFSGHGFKFTPLIGEVLADLATTGSTGHDIGLFDPSRTPVEA